MLVLVAAPSAAPVASTTIVVATRSDEANGDTSSVAALFANPGPDGISLREAVQATNNDPGTHTIRFAEAMTIDVGRILPPLVGGNISIEGPATIRATPEVAQFPGSTGFQLSSSGNRLRGLTLDGFPIGVDIRPFAVRLPVGLTYADNAVESLTIHGARTGIRLTFYSLACESPCPTHNTWINTTVTHNTIEASQDAIHFSLMNVVGDRLEGATITDNTIRFGTAATPVALGPPIQIDVSGNSTASRIANVLVARNTIESFQSGGDGAIFIGAGLQRAHENTIENVRILDNRIRVQRPSSSVPCCFGVVVSAGTDFLAVDPRIGGDNYPDGNVVKNVEVARNMVSGALAAAVRVQAGVDAGGSHNRAEGVRVTRNVTRSSILGKGVYLWVGQAASGRPATGNAIRNVRIDTNRITTGKGPRTVDTVRRTAGGIVVLGGENLGRDGLIRGVRITNNRIATAQVGIRVVGGRSTASGNRVSCIRLARNRITGTRVRVWVRANVDGASRNRATLAC